MNTKNSVLFSFLFFIAVFANAQRSNIWYFGANAGLNFNTNPPTILTNGQSNITDNTTTISDAGGNLLFYTDGVTVWNSIHFVMANGTGLIGNYSAGQCALIVPMPCNPDKYIIFHVTEFSTPGQLHYTVVDMSLNAGLGGVVSTQKNISLGTGYTEKLCAYYNTAGGNYWVLTHRWNSNQFVAFDVNSNSIATSSVVSSIGSVHNCGSYGAAHDALGQLTISRDGTKVLNALTCQDKFELFSFNSVTGILSNSISIPGTGGYQLGTAFSPNSLKIYVGTVFGKSILQYDISTYNQIVIAASQYSIVTVSTGGCNFGYMELGPDNKLYIGKPSANYLSVVNNPNGLGAACNFSLVGQSLGSKTSNHGLSRVAYNIPSGISGAVISISANPNATISCINPNLSLTASGTLSPSSYTWVGPGITGAVNGKTITAVAIGVYSCSAPGCGGISSSTFAVSGSTIAPTISISASSQTICLGYASTLTPTGASTYTLYPGQIVNTLPYFVINPPVSNNFTIVGTNSLGCTGSGTKSLTVIPLPTLTITPLSPTLCAGASVSFSPVGGINYTLQPWGLSGSSGPFVITVSITTQYTLTGSGPGGCVRSITNTLLVNPTPTLTISPASNTLCSGITFSLSGSGASTYTWYPGNSNGSMLTSGPVFANASYTLDASSAEGCTATVVKTLTVISSPTVSAVSNPTNICAGGSVTLSATGAANYTWLPVQMSGQSVIVSPLTATIYTLVGESNGCESRSTILIGNPLSPTISSSGNIDCNNTSVFIYIAANSNTYALAWAGPGITGPVSSSVINTSSAGVYTVVLTNTITNCSAINTISIQNSIAQFSLNIIPSTTLTCYPGPAINLLVSTSANFSWFPAPLVMPPTGPLVYVNPDVTTTYTVVGTLGVCSGSAVITISVNATPTVVTGVNTMSLCAGVETSLAASGAPSYQWYPGSQNGSSIAVSPLSTTIYTVTGINANCSASEHITVTVLPTPALSVNAFPQTMCVGQAATLTAVGATSINWLSPGFSSSLSTVFVNPFTPTTFTVVGTNSSGCSSYTSVFVNVIAGSAIFAETSASLVCSDETVDLTVTGATNYTWLPSNQTGSLVVGSQTVSTNYTVVAENLGCKSFTTVLVSVQECIRTVFGITNSADEPESIGETYKIDFIVTAANSSIQNLRNVILNDDLAQTFSYPCTYTVVQAPRINSSGSSLKTNALFDGYAQMSLTSPSSSTLMAGKRDTIVFSVLVEPHGFSGLLYNRVVGFADLRNTKTISDTSNNGFNWDPDQDGNPTNNNEITPLEIRTTELFIPQGFSPDGNGQYDFFVIKGLNGRRVNITIFNRWGNKVFEKGNYDNTWDGTANFTGPGFGKGKLPEGTYYYSVEFQDGKKEVKTGFVVLRHD